MTSDVPTDDRLDDVGTTEAARQRRVLREVLRTDRRQWHRRGLRAPEEIAALVLARLSEDDEPSSPPEPGTEELTYGDFFVRPTN